MQNNSTNGRRFMAAQILRDSGGVQLAGHLQAVEALHPADGFGQHLRGLHGGPLAAGLRQVAEVTQPCLRERERDRERRANLLKGQLSLGEKGLRARWCCPGAKKQREELNREAERKSRCFVLALPHSRLLPSRSEAIGIRRRKRTPNDPRGSVFDILEDEADGNEHHGEPADSEPLTRKDALPFKESQNSRKTTPPPVTPRDS